MGQVEFGYYPHELDFSVGDLTVQSVPNLGSTVEAVSSCGGVEGGWCYAPVAETNDFISGAVRTSPHPSRVFGLPMTHVLRHATSQDAEHLRFLVWMLGFILGVRLTDTEAGFLDATPIERGALHDIIWLNNSQLKAVAIADAFWCTHRSNQCVTKGLTGVVHCLFLSQTPTLLEFEQFIYLYTALDGCHAVRSAMIGKPPNSVRHFKRIAELCRAFSRPVPSWADERSGTLAGERNETLHEGLFFDEPLGFQVYGGNASAGSSRQNVLLEMRCLVCRVICGLIGFQDRSYIASALDTRQRMGVRL